MGIVEPDQAFAILTMQGEAVFGAACNPVRKCATIGGSCPGPRPLVGSIAG